MKTQSWLLVIALIVIGFLLFDKFYLTKPIYSGSDTTITVNHYFDTTIHTTENSKTVYLPSKIITVERSVYKVDSSDCDSIRTYTPTSSDTQVQILSSVIIHGKLLDYKANYKLLKPIRTEITKTITNTIERNGFVLGVGSTFNEFNAGLSGNVGYKYNDFIITGGYSTNSQATIQIYKLFGKP